MNHRSHYGLILLVVLVLGVTFLPAAAPAIADCTPVGSALDQLFTCDNDPAPDSDGLDVGTGDDTVNVIGTVTGNTGIESDGDNSTLRVYVIGPDGEINVIGTAIWMNGDGDVTLEIDDGRIVTGGNIGIWLAGNGNVTSTGTLSGGTTGIWLAGNGNVTSTGTLSGGTTGIWLNGNGNVTSTGSVTGGDLGIWLNGNGNVTSTGTLSGGTTGIWLNGNGNVTSTGSVTGDDLGIWLNGNGNVTSTGSVTGGDYGIWLNGNGNVTSTGSVTGDDFGIWLGGNGNVTSTGDVTGGEFGIWLTGNGNVTSAGSVTGDDFGIWLTGNGNVTSTGSVTGDDFGIWVTGNGNVTSAGSVTGDDFGIWVTGNGNVTSTGDVTGTANSGIYVIGDGEVRAQGSVHGGTVAIEGGAGDQLVMIDAIITSGSSTAVNVGAGDDGVALRGGASVHGDILMGSGNDTVQIGSGSSADGLIDGGDDTDTLIVGDEVLCREDSGTLDRQTSTGALVSGLDLSADTFTFDSNTYEIANFEVGENGIRRTQCVPKLEDGRLNSYDIGAWVAGYCNTEDGVNLWAIDVDGNGQADLSVSGATMRAALEQAVASGENTLVGSGPRGTSLWALASNQYQMMGPDARNPGQQYVHIFAPGTCGMGNSLQG